MGLKMFFYQLAYGYSWNILFWLKLIMMGTWKLENINFLFDSLHCKPDLKCFTWANLHPWRYGKANLVLEKRMVWTGGRKSWAASASHVIWPVVHQNVSFLAFAQTTPTCIWVCMKHTDLHILEHPSGSGFVFIRSPTWHRKICAKNQSRICFT